jgi:HSP20 family protein
MFSPSSAHDASWNTPLDEGQLSVDVFRHGKDLVIRSTISGASPEDLDISFHGDLLTIRGKRELEHDVKDEDWFYRECYWGAFSRSIVLPYDVTPDRAEASLKNGVLEIRIPIKSASERSVKVKVKE